MSREWRALRHGESAETRRREIELAYELFLSGKQSDRQLSLSSVRNVVLESWRRSLGRLVDPEANAISLALSTEELAELRRIHPLASALPVINRLLVDEASDSGFIVAVGDAQGRLLWVDGDHHLRGKAESIGFVPGTDWSERAVGTSAPGSALALGHPIQVFGAEHFSRSVHQWSCAATPVHDPETGVILGVIDITGGETVAEPHVLPLVEATRHAVEAELKLEAMKRRMESSRAKRYSTPSQSSPHVPNSRPSLPTRLTVLGRQQALLATQSEVLELSRRHAEILLALSRASHGLSASALALQVYGDGDSQETLRAELVRLRKFFSAHEVGLTIESRPYQLRGSVQIDATDALAALGRGAHRLALASYGGPVLLGSESPVVLELREDLDATLREAMLQCASPDLLFEYAQQWAEDDLQVWQTLLQILPPLSPKRSRVVAKIEHLQD